jgi:hypothetical protein
MAPTELEFGGWTCYERPPLIIKQRSLKKALRPAYQDGRFSRWAASRNFISVRLSAGV